MLMVDDQHEYLLKKCLRKIDDRWYEGIITDVIPFTSPPVLVIKYDDDNNTEEYVYIESNIDFKFIPDISNEYIHNNINRNIIENDNMSTYSSVSGDISQISKNEIDHTVESLDVLNITEPCNFCAKLTIYRCGGCNKSSYCSRKCQRKAWRKHRKQCTYKKIDENLLPTRSDLNLSKSLSSSSRSDNCTSTFPVQGYYDSSKEYRDNNSVTTYNYVGLHTNTTNPLRQSDSNDSLEAHIDPNDQLIEDDEWERARQQGWSNNYTYTNESNQSTSLFSNSRSKSFNHSSSGSSSGNESGSSNSAVSDDEEIYNLTSVPDYTNTSNYRPQLKVNIDDGIYGYNDRSSQFYATTTVPTNTIDKQSICQTCVDSPNTNQNEADIIRKVNEILDIIPVSESQARDALRVFYGDLEASIDYLLNQSTSDEPPPLTSNIINNSLHEVD